MGRGLLISLLLCWSATAQILGSIIVHKKASGGGGMGAWTLINHVKQPGNGNDFTVITPAINCTGANLYVIFTMSYNGAPAGARYDPGDGGHDITNSSGFALSTANVRVGMFWVDGITGAPSVTFAAHTNYGWVFASCWAGAISSSAKDQESASGSVTCYPCSPSLTPTADGTLIVLAGEPDTLNNGILSAPSFTTLDNQVGIASASWAGSVLYKVLASGTSGVAQSVTVTSTPTDTGAVKMVNFKHQ